jgi:hypothetical protein
MFRFLSILLFFLGNHLAFQAQSILKNFSGRQINTDVIGIEWISKAGNTCSDLRIERSLDAGPFYQVFRFNGICGVADAEQFYAFYDTIMQNGTYAYRINENSGVYSDTIEIQAFIDGFELVAFPNPAGEYFTLRTNSGDTNEFVISILSLDGKIVREKSSVKTGDWISITSINSGLYMLLIETKDLFYYSPLVKN